MKKTLYIISASILVVLFSIVGYYIYVVNTSVTARSGNYNSPSSYVENLKLKIRKSIHILAVGDTAILEPLASKVLNDPNLDPLANVKDIFKKYDYVVANVETTIDGASVSSPQAGKPYTFSSPKISAEIFKKAGITAANLANNHTKDYGSKGVLHTIELLNGQGIGTFGAGVNSNASYTPLIVDLKGTKVAFLGYDSAEYSFNHSTETDAGTASFVDPRVKNSIIDAKSKADIVIVYTHWGIERTQNLDPTWQVQWAKNITSYGADIIIGGHPHVIQQNTIVNGKPVFYSIGNFMHPGQGGIPEVFKAQAIEIIIEDKKIKETKIHEVNMSAEGIPSIKE